MVLVLRVEERVPLCPLAFGLKVEELQHSFVGLRWVSLPMMVALKESYFQQDRTVGLFLTLVSSNQYKQGQYSKIQDSYLHSNSIRIEGRHNFQV